MAPVNEAPTRRERHDEQAELDVSASPLEGEAERHAAAKREAGAYGGAEQAAEMRASARLRDVILAMRMHDIKGQLSGISLNADILKRIRVDASDAVAHLSSSVEQIRTALSRLNVLLDEMPSIERVDLGTVAGERRPQSLSTLVAFAVRAVEPVTRLRDVRVTTEVCDDAKTLSCDGARTVMVIAALLLGAARRTPAEGCVRFIASRVGTTTRLAVHDGGSRLRPEEVSSLLASVAVADGGLPPLRMFTARRGIELQGGRLEARPGDDGGMVFEAIMESRPDRA